MSDAPWRVETEVFDVLLGILYAGQANGVTGAAVLFDRSSGVPNEVFNDFFDLSLVGRGEPVLNGVNSFVVFPDDVFPEELFHDFGFEGVPRHGGASFDKLIKVLFFSNKLSPIDNTYKCAYLQILTKTVDEMATNNRLQENRDQESEPFAEGTALTYLFGDHPKPRILATMLSESDRDLSVTEIARLSGLNRTTIYEHLDDLLELDVIINTRRTAGQMYQINRDSQVAQDLAKLEWDLLDHLPN